MKLSEKLRFVLLPYFRRNSYFSIESTLLFVCNCVSLLVNVLICLQSLLPPILLLLKKIKMKKKKKSNNEELFKKLYVSITPLNIFSLPRNHNLWLSKVNIFSSQLSKKHWLLFHSFFMSCEKKNLHLWWAVSKQCLAKYFLVHLRHICGRTFPYILKHFTR